MKGTATGVNVSAQPPQKPNQCIQYPTNPPIPPTTHIRYLPDHGVGPTGVPEPVRARVDALGLPPGVAGAAHVLARGEGKLCVCMCFGRF